MERRGESFEMEEALFDVQAGDTVYYQSEDQGSGIMLLPFTDYSDEVIGFFQIVEDREGVLNQIAASRNMTIGITAGISALMALTLFAILQRFCHKSTAEG